MHNLTLVHCEDSYELRWTQQQVLVSSPSMYVPPRSKEKLTKCVWHKLNAGSLEDQRTSLVSDADDFLNPFSSACVCVCVCVFSFSSFGRSNEFTQNLLLLIFK